MNLTKKKSRYDSIEAYCASCRSPVCNSICRCTCGMSDHNWNFQPGETGSRSQLDTIVHRV